jgi:polar amino acid transport system ATP-binding protein
VIGPSGSGKSTFLRCINHLEQINAGRLWVDGVLVGYRQRGDKLYELRESEVAHQRIDVGMVFQQFNLFPHMTAFGNVVEAPLRVKGEPRREVHERARALLERVGLAEKAGAYPSQLSGGQQQRVAIARALVMEPALILADEPTGNLDSVSAREVMELLRRLNEGGTTMMIITHDLQVARYAERVIEIRDGRIGSDSRVTAGVFPEV